MISVRDFIRRYQSAQRAREVAVAPFLHQDQTPRQRRLRRRFRFVSMVLLTWQTT
jgi:hypothetical protein